MSSWLQAGITAVLSFNFIVFGCEFEDFSANCDMLIGDKHNVSLYLVVNKCHNPVDVSILVKFLENEHFWKHTFANRDEMKEILVTSDKIFIELHVAVNDDRNNSVYVQGSFSMNDINYPPFVNSSVTLPNDRNHCIKDTSFKNIGGVVTLVVFVVIILFIVIVSIVCVWFKRQKHKLDRDALVGADDAIDNQRSYQEDPALNEGVLSNEFLPGSSFPRLTTKNHSSATQYLRKNKGRKEYHVRRSTELCFDEDETPFTDL